MACLAKNPEERPASAAAISALIDQPEKEEAPAAEEPVSEPKVEPAPEIISLIPPEPAKAPIPQEPVWDADTISEEDEKSDDAPSIRRVRALVNANPKLAICAAFALLGLLAFLGWYFSAPPPAAQASESHPQEPAASATIDENAVGKTIDLFNGRNLEGWHGNTRYWSVEDGILSGRMTAGENFKTFLVLDNRQVSDFKLHFLFRSFDANSGVFFRAREPQTDHIEGYQFEIWSSSTGGLLDVRDNGERRDLARLGQKAVATNESGVSLVKITGSLGQGEDLRRAIHPESWNEGVIVAQGNHVTQMINGVVTAEATDNDPARALKSGLIALELFSTGGPERTIQFKSIRLTPL
jgi:hypothetical protein